MITTDPLHGTMKLEPSDEVLKELYRLRAETEIHLKAVEDLNGIILHMQTTNADLRAENEKLRADLAEYIAQAERGHQTMVADACEFRKEIARLRAAAAALKETDG